jgi:hypothetical protein
MASRCPWSDRERSLAMSALSLRGAGAAAEAEVEEGGDREGEREEEEEEKGRTQKGREEGKQRSAVPPLFGFHVGVCLSECGVCLEG